MTVTTSRPLDLPDIREVDEIARADLVFYGVDHSGPSFQALVFINNGDASAETERTLDNGFAGAFSVFGHNGCYGDRGHCLPDARFTDEFDMRAPHPLRPLTVTVIATEAVRGAMLDPAVRQIVVTTIAVVPDDEFPKASASPLTYEYVRLLTYEN
jgi:tyrosinase